MKPSFISNTHDIELQSIQQKSQLQQTQSQIDQVLKDNSELSIQLGQLERQLEIEKKKSLESALAAEKNQKRNEFLTKRSSELEGMVKTLELQLTAKQQEKVNETRKLRSQCSEIQTELEQEKKEKCTLIEKIENMKKESKEFCSKIDDLKKELETQVSLRKKSETLSEEYTLRNEELNTKLSNVLNSNKEYENKNNQLNFINKKKDEEVDKLKKKVERLDAQCANVQDTNQKLLGTLGQLEREKDELKQENKKVSQNLIQLKSQLIDENQAKNNLSAKVHEFEEKNAEMIFNFTFQLKFLRL
jgi:chromosome segregation ATPase